MLLVTSKSYQLTREAVRQLSEAALSYADLQGADEIRIIKPVNDKAAKYYASYGYEVIQPIKKKMPAFCSMKLRS